MITDYLPGILIALVVVGYVGLRLYWHECKKKQALRKFERDEEDRKALLQRDEVRKEIQREIDAVPIKLGDVVRLKNQTTRMTAEGVNFPFMYNGVPHVYCLWFDAEGKLQRDSFRHDLLEKADG